MLISLVALMEAEGPGTIPLTTGELMQGALLQHVAGVSREAAGLLHGDRDVPRPYTISPLMCDHEQLRNRELVIAKGDRTWFRVTGLNAGVAELLMEMASRTSRWDLRTASTAAQFRINHWRSRASEHPWSGCVSHEGLWQSAYYAMKRQPDRIWLDFETPTGFDGPADHWPNWNHLPLPQSVFGSLRKRQRILAPDFGKPPEGEERLETAVALGKFKVQSHALRFEKHGSTESGFTGSCEYLIHPEAAQEEVFWLHLLGGLAFYTGVGMKTSWGMGMTRRSRYLDFTYRGSE